MFLRTILLPTTICMIWMINLAQVCSAQPNGVKTDSRHTSIIKFLTELKSGDPDAAYQALLKNSPLLKKQKKLKALIAQTKTIEKLYGECKDFEAIEDKQIGKDVVIIKYLYKCDTYPVVWYFTFYRKPDKNISDDARAWFIITVRFDTDVELLGL